MLASDMFLRTLTASLLALMSAVLPASAQLVPAPDCTVDGTLFDADGLKLDIVYRCRSSTALDFHADGDRIAGKVMSFRDGGGHALLPSANTWRVESLGGLVEAHYRYDLTGYARAVDQTSVAVQRGGGVLAILSSWLLEPRGYQRAPTIDIRMITASGLVFAAGLPRVGDAWRLTGTTVRFAGYSALGRLSAGRWELRPAPPPEGPGPAVASSRPDCGRAD